MMNHPRVTRIPKMIIQIFQMMDNLMMINLIIMMNMIQMKVMMVLVPSS
jgi:hypothetical protein